MGEVSDVHFWCVGYGLQNGDVLSYYKLNPFLRTTSCYCSMLVCRDCRENPGRCGICTLVKTHYGTSNWQKEFRKHKGIHDAADKLDMFFPFIRFANISNWYEIANIVDNPDAPEFQELKKKYRDFVDNYVTKPRLFYILNSAVMRNFRVFTFKSTGNILDFLDTIQVKMLSSIRINLASSLCFWRIQCLARRLEMLTYLSSEDISFGPF